MLFWPSRPLFSGFSSTKSRFLCFFGLRNPRFQGFRAQNRGFCAQEEGKVGLENVTAETLTTLLPHLRRRTSAPAHQHPHTSTRTPAPAHQHPHTSSSVPTPAHQPSNDPHQWHQAPSSAVLAPCSAVHAPSSAVWCRVMPSSTAWHRLGTM